MSTSNAPVFITGKLLRVEHYKSGFVTFSAEEPTNLWELMHAALADAMVCIRHSTVWATPEEAYRILKELDQTVSRTTNKRRDAFRTRFVEFPQIWSHTQALEIYSREAYHEWLFQRGQRYRPFLHFHRKTPS